MTASTATTLAVVITAIGGLVSGFVALVKARKEGSSADRTLAVEEVNSALQVLGAVVDRLEVENVKLRDEVAVLQATNAELRQEVTTLRAEVEQLRQAKEAP